MALHPKTLRAIKRSALYATIISAVGLLFVLISGFIFHAGLTRLPLLLGIIAYVLLVPGVTLINCIMLIRYPNHPVSVPVYLVAAASLVIYFGLFCLFHFIYYKVRKSSAADKPLRT